MNIESMSYLKLKLRNALCIIKLFRFYEEAKYSFCKMIHTVLTTKQQQQTSQDNFLLHENFKTKIIIDVKIGHCRK